MCVYYIGTKTDDIMPTLKLREVCDAVCVIENVKYYIMLCKQCYYLLQLL